MHRVKVLKSSQLDYDAFAEMETAAFAEVFEANRTQGQLSADLFKWKHNPPAGEGKIAVVFDDKKMIAANAMFPLFVHKGEHRIKGWQSCDTATLPEARGKGCFMKCLSALREALGPDDLFFGFPNKNSVPGFLKIGWKEIQPVTTWARIPAWLSLPSKDQAIVSIDNFRECPKMHWQELIANDSAALVHDNDYLHWRYLSHPQFEYITLGYIEADRLLGVVACRSAKVMGKNCFLIMDLIATTAGIERRLLKCATRIAKKQNIGNIIMMNSKSCLSAAWSNGYLPLPTKLLPKRQVLMGEARGKAALFLDYPWQVQTGDWDAF